MGIQLQRARVGRLISSQPVIALARPLWYIEVYQYDSRWNFLGKESSRPIDSNDKGFKDFRDVVLYPHEAQTFERKVDAEQFAFRIATINPHRIGLIRVVKYPEKANV